MSSIHPKTLVELKKISQLGEEEKKATEILMNHIPGNLREKCKKIKVTHTMLLRWKKNPKKFSYITYLIIDYAKENLK